MIARWQLNNGTWWECIFSNSRNSIWKLQKFNSKLICSLALNCCSFRQCFHRASMLCFIFLAEFHNSTSCLWRDQWYVHATSTSVLIFYESYVSFQNILRTQIHNFMRSTKWIAFHYWIIILLLFSRYNGTLAADHWHICLSVMISAAVANSRRTQMELQQRPNEWLAFDEKLTRNTSCLHIRLRLFMVRHRDDALADDIQHIRNLWEKICSEIQSTRSTI